VLETRNKGFVNAKTSVAGPRSNREIIEQCGY